MKFDFKDEYCLKYSINIFSILHVSVNSALHGTDSG
jgi:hypothetical protein